MKRGGKLNNRGLSDIVVTLIIVLLSMVAIGVVWVVVNNLLQSGTEQTTTAFDTLTLNMEIERVMQNSSGVSVTVSRGSGSGNIAGVAIVLSDGENSKVIKANASNFNPLEQKNFFISSSELGEIIFVKEVSVSPIVGSDYNKGTVGNVLSSLAISNEQVLSDWGAVSWWKLDGNANDELGNNPGTIQGSVQFVEGKYGKSGGFDGKGSYIHIGTNPNLNGKDGFTSFVWVRRDGNSTASQWPIIFGCSNSHIYYTIRTHSWGATLYFEYGLPPYDGGTGKWTSFASSSILPAGTWYNYAITYNGSTLKAYKNGALIDTRSGVDLIDTLDSVRINNGGAFNGSIDEVMFFNKELTAEQIKALYETDLSS